MMDEADLFFIVGFVAVGFVIFGVTYQLTASLGEAVTGVGISYTSMAAAMLYFEYRNTEGPES